MPIQFHSAPSGNPFEALLQGQKFGQNLMQFPQQMQEMRLANAMNEYKRQQMAAQSKYYEPMAQFEYELAKLAPQEKQQLMAQRAQQMEYNPDIWKSEIGYRNAETEINKFKLKNPAYINADAALISHILQGQQNSQTPKIPDQQTSQFPGQHSDQFNQQSPQFQGQQNPQMQSQQYPAMAGQQNQQPTEEKINPSAFSFDTSSYQSPTNNPALDALYYKRFGMDPISQQQLAISTQAAESDRKSNLERASNASIASTFANDQNIYAEKFIQSLDKLHFLESNPIISAPAVTSAAREAEADSANMVIAATKLFQGENAVRAADIELNSMAKANRRQGKEVAFDLAQGIIAKNNRLKDKQQFYALGAHMKLKPEILDTMWNKFETDRPYYDVDSHMPNSSYDGTWRDYLNPKSINSFISGKSYTPENTKVLKGVNFNKDDINHIKTWSIKNGYSKEGWTKQDIFFTARNKNMTLPQLKMELMKRGALNHGE